MEYRVYLEKVLAKVKGEVITLFRAVVDHRTEGAEKWDRCDQSLLFDSALDCHDESVELTKLYGADPWKPLYSAPLLKELGRVVDLTRNAGMVGAMDGGSNKVRTG